jgi:transcription factor SPT20
MIVELLDYRRQRNKDPLPPPERTRVVLYPNSETLWADLCLLNQRAGNKWTDSESLQVEARILVSNFLSPRLRSMPQLLQLATAPPLCLDPDPHVTRIANNILRVSHPGTPACLKRKAAALDPEEDETDKARRAKVMQFMNPRPLRTHGPRYALLLVSI